MESENRTAASVVEQVFTSANPQTGSRPPEHIAWVVFENDTVFFTAPTEELPVDAAPEALANAARAALDELGPVRPGTESADFTSRLLDAWFPGEHIYLVTYNHPSVGTIVLAHADNDLVAGMEGRSRRDADLEARAIQVIRGFDGRTHRPGG